MTPEELIERIKGLNNKIIQLGKRDPEALAELDDLHRAAFGVGFEESCRNCVTKAFHKLQALTLEKLQNMNEQKFKLRKGVVLQYPAFSPDFYTSENITDEVAAKYLKENPDGASFFTEIPEDSDLQDDDEDENQNSDSENITDEVDDQDESALTAKELIAKIKETKSLEDLQSLVPEGEDRKTVLEASERRTAELTNSQE